MTRLAARLRVVGLLSLHLMVLLHSKVLPGVLAQAILLQGLGQVKILLRSGARSELEQSRMYLRSGARSELEQSRMYLRSCARSELEQSRIYLRSCARSELEQSQMCLRCCQVCAMRLMPSVALYTGCTHVPASCALSCCWRLYIQFAVFVIT
jgi:hypothetical protein